MSHKLRARGSNLALKILICSVHGWDHTYFQIYAEKEQLSNMVMSLLMLCDFFTAKSFNVMNPKTKSFAKIKFLLHFMGAGNIQSALYRFGKQTYRAE